MAEHTPHHVLANLSVADAVLRAGDIIEVDPTDPGWAACIQARMITPVRPVLGVPTPRSFPAEHFVPGDGETKNEKLVDWVIRNGDTYLGTRSRWVTGRDLAIVFDSYDAAAKRLAGLLKRHPELDLQAVAEGSLGEPDA